MSCSLPPVVEEYLTLIEQGEHRACRYQIALARHIRMAFATEDLFVESERLEKYLGIAKYFPFQELYPWEKFLTALWLCTYKAPGQPRWKELFCMLGRGAGKDGYIAFASLCLVSPYNPSRAYNVEICAENKDQATRPVSDLYDVLEDPKTKIKLSKFFYHTKERVRGKKNGGRIQGRAKNPKGRDGLRPGAVIFNEVHQYENYLNIDVYTTALGKTTEPRIGSFTSNGLVNDGPLDDHLEDARQVLFEGAPDNGVLYFICCLDEAAEIDDEANWYKANPSLAYNPTLLQETRDEYIKYKKRPDENQSFMVKRMGIRKGNGECAVTDYEKIKATNKPLPDLKGWSCTLGFDYAELSDWAALNFHFRKGQNRFDVNHAWLTTQSKTLGRVRAPWQSWADRGLITVVDEPTIRPELITENIRAAAQIYNILGLAMDNFRWTLVSEAFIKIGFDARDKSRVKLIRPSDIMKIDPVIQNCFDLELFSWGDNSCLRWAANNTKRVAASAKAGSNTGNFYYAKIEAKSRKTDPFMALAASMVIEDKLGTGEEPKAPLKAFAL